MDPNVRPARPSDSDTIYRFICELATYEREPDAVEVTSAILRDQLESDNPPFECLIAETIEGEALGFALFFTNYSTWRGRPGIYLEDLYVPEPLRGRGIGLKLLKHLARVAVERNCARLEWAVLNWNQPAIDFYRSVGATPMSEWTTWRLTDLPLRRMAGAK